MFKFIILLMFMPLYLLSNDRTLIFAPLPMKDIQTTYTQFSPLVRFLEQKLNTKIKIDYNKNYDQILKKFVNKEIDIAYLGPLPYLSLEKMYSNVVPLVNFKNEKGEVSYTCSFVSFISNNNSMENMENTKIALTQPLSTCGYLFVNNILNNSNSNIEKNKYRYLGRHDKVALSVILSEFKYGGLKTETAKEYFHLGLKEIKRSSKVPNFLLVANSKTLNKEILKKIKDSILLLNKEDLSRWHKSMKFGVKEFNTKDYNHLRKLIKSLNISKEGNF